MVASPYARASPLSPLCSLLLLRYVPQPARFEYRNRSLFHRNHFVGIGHDTVIVPRESGAHLFLGDDNCKVDC